MFIESSIPLLTTINREAEKKVKGTSLWDAYHQEEVEQTTQQPEVTP